jgi:hypothetical protein
VDNIIECTISANCSTVTSHRDALSAHVRSGALPKLAGGDDVCKPRVKVREEVKPGDKSSYPEGSGGRVSFVSSNQPSPLFALSVYRQLAPEEPAAICRKSPVPRGKSAMMSSLSIQSWYTVHLSKRSLKSSPQHETSLALSVLSSPVFGPPSAL